MAEKKNAKKLIKDVFLDLFQEKGISQITVTEICKEAQINRATFYKYYEDVYELKRAIEKGILEELSDIIEKLNSKSYERIVYNFLVYLDNMDSRYWVFFASQGEDGIGMQVFLMLYQYAFPIMNSKMPKTDEEKTEMLYYYISRGTAGIVAHWLEAGKKIDIQDVADYITTYSTATMKGVLTGNLN